MSISPQLGEPGLQRVGAASIAYRASGTGRPLVFVHGVLANGDVWRDVVPILNARFRCIVPDWPLGAHTEALPGDADVRPPALAKLIADFIAALGLTDAVLVASDTGGALAQLVVTAHPERIGALVLTNCDAFENFFPPVLRPLTYLARVPGFIDVLAFALRAVALQRLVVACVAHRRPEPELLRSYFGPSIENAAVRRDLRNVVAAVDNRYTLAAARLFSGFVKPVGIAWGEDDPIFFPLRFARRLCDAFPYARLRTFPGSRAFVSEDRPRELAEFIAEIANERARDAAPALTRPAGTP